MLRIAFCELSPMCVCAYIYDILITEDSDQEHLSTLDKKLYPSWKHWPETKVGEVFFNPGVSWILESHDICRRTTTNAGEGLYLCWGPTPHNVTQKCSFLELISYYRKFLPNLASTLVPLHRLLQKKLLAPGDQVVVTILPFPCVHLIPDLLGK